MVAATINDRWQLELLEHRRKFHAERPRWEQGRLDAMCDTIRDLADVGAYRPVVWDVGAEEGDFTALYRTWGARLVAIEPQPAYWPAIRATWELNGFDDWPVCVEGFAAHDSADNTPICYGYWPDASDGPIQPDYGFRHLAQDTSTPRITIDDLAGFLGSSWYPDVVTIDVEGAEWHVLDGAADLLSEVAPVVYVSVHEPTLWNWYERTPAQIDELMDDLGYDARWLDHHGEAETFREYVPKGSAP